MIQVASVKSGEVWSSARSGSLHFDLDLGEGGDLTIRVDDDGKWSIDIHELATGHLRDFLVQRALARGTRDGICQIGNR